MIAMSAAARQRRGRAERRRRRSCCRLRVVIGGAPAAWRGRAKYLSSVGTSGGRVVKACIVAGARPDAAAIASATARRHSLPWQGPVPKPV